MYLFIRSGLTWSDYRKVGWLKKTESGSGSSTVCSTTGRPLPLIDSGNDKCSSGVNLLQDLLATKDKLTHAEVRCQSLAAEKERLKSSEARLISENEMLHRNQQTRDQLVISLEAIQVCTSTGVPSAHTALQWVILAVFKLSFCFLHLIFYFGNFCFASYIFNWTFIFLCHAMICVLQPMPSCGVRVSVIIVQIL